MRIDVETGILTISLIGYGVMTATARYFYDVNHETKKLSILAWLMSCSVGATVSVITGFIIYAPERGMWQLGVIGISGILSNDLMRIAIKITPEIFEAIVKKHAGVNTGVNTGVNNEYPQEYMDDTPVNQDNPKRRENDY